MPWEYLHWHPGSSSISSRQGPGDRIILSSICCLWCSWIDGQSTFSRNHEGQHCWWEWRNSNGKTLLTSSSLVFLSALRCGIFFSCFLLHQSVLHKVKACATILIMLHSYEAGGPQVILLLFAIYFSSSKFQHKHTYCWSAWLEQYSVPMQALHWGLWMPWLWSALLGCLKCLLTHVECQGDFWTYHHFWARLEALDKPILLQPKLEILDC